LEAEQRKLAAMALIQIGITSCQILQGNSVNVESSSFLKVELEVKWEAGRTFWMVQSILIDHI
jgi:hypothetical protein